MLIERLYSNHSVFEKLLKYAEFYNDLSDSIIGFASLGVYSYVNIDTYVYRSISGTLESIRNTLLKGRVSDAYALLRKYYDAAIINVYINLYLIENFTEENLIVEKIEKWRRGLETLPDTRSINNYIEKSEKTRRIYHLLHKDNRYSELRKRCNDNTHYNFYYNILLNDNTYNYGETEQRLNDFESDLENILILHLSYLFYIKEYYMMSSDYVDSLDIGVTPEPNSQYFVAPFIQEIFDTVIKKNRMDLVTEIKKKTSMLLE